MTRNKNAIMVADSLARAEEYAYQLPEVQTSDDLFLDLLGYIDNAREALTKLEAGR